MISPSFSKSPPNNYKEIFWFNPSAFDGNYWSVGYTTFLAAIKAMVGTATNVLQATHIGLGLILIVLTWLISSSLNSRVKIIATCLVAFNSRVGDGSFGWIRSSFGRCPRERHVIHLADLHANRVAQVREGVARLQKTVVLTSGLFLGIAVMIQSKAFILVLVFAIYWFRSSLRVAISGISGVLLVLLPWSIRNFFVLGSINPFNSNGPVNFWIGNNPDQTTGGFMDPPILPDGSGCFVDSAIKFTVSQPEFAVQLLLRKRVRLVEPMYFYFGDRQPSIFQWSLHVVTIFLGGAILLGFVFYLVGRVWVFSPPMPPLGLIAAIVVMFYLVNLPFIAESRFVAPLLPLTTIVAVSAFLTLLERRDRWRTMSN